MKTLLIAFFSLTLFTVSAQVKSKQDTTTHATAPITIQKQQWDLINNTRNRLAQLEQDWVKLNDSYVVMLTTVAASVSVDGKPIPIADVRKVVLKPKNTVIIRYAKVKK